MKDNGREKSNIITNRDNGTSHKPSMERIRVRGGATTTLATPSIINTSPSSHKPLSQRERNAIERLKVLDPAFGDSVNELEQTWLGEANTKLSSILTGAMTILDHLQRKLSSKRNVLDPTTGKPIEVDALSVDEMLQVLRAHRELMTELAEQYNVAIGRPTSITANAHLHKHKVTLMEDDVLDKEILRLQGHLQYKPVTFKEYMLDGNKEADAVVVNSNDNDDDDSDNDDIEDEHKCEPEAAVVDIDDNNKEGEITSYDNS